MDNHNNRHEEREYVVDFGVRIYATSEWEAIKLAGKQLQQSPDNFSYDGVRDITDSWWSHM